MSQTFPSSPSTRLRLWACNAGLMCVAIAVNLPPVFFTTFSRTFGGLTDEQLGRIPATVFACLTLGIVLSGPLADRWGAKRFAVIGLALTAVGLALVGLARNFEMLLVSTAVMGLGAGVLDMVLSPIVAALAPHRKHAAMNWLHSFYCTGAVLTVLFGSTAIHVDFNWRGVFLAAAVFPALILVAFALMHVPPLVFGDGGRLSVRRLLRSGFFVAALVAIFLGGATEAAMDQWLPAYAEKHLGYSPSSAGLALAGFLAAMVVGRILSALLAERVRPIAMMTVACVFAAGFYAVGCFVARAPVALVGCMAVGLAVSCLWPTLLSATSHRFPSGGATMFAILAAAGNAGCFVMPWVVGAVADRTALNVGLATAGLCPIILLVALWRMGRDRS